jgi:hypothetical protein
VVEPDQVVGVTLTGNAYRSKRSLLGYEFGVNSGIETTASPNGSVNYIGALHFKTEDMHTSVDYGIFIGNAQIRPDKNASNFPGTAWRGVYSPRSQLYQYSSLAATHDFSNHWDGWGELTVGRQAGDGKSDTIHVTTSKGGFRGAEWGRTHLGRYLQEAAQSVVQRALSTSAIPMDIPRRAQRL